MSSQVEFLVFGDQSYNSHAFLADFYSRGRPSTLSKLFLDQVCAALILEIDALPSIYRQNLPVFSNIKELDERHYQDGGKDCAIDNALLCICQLVHYIDQSEKTHSKSLKSSERYLIGSSAGVFAAFAVAISSSVSTLISNAVDLAVIAFRTGHHVSAMGSQFSDSAEIKSWTYFISGTSDSVAASIIDRFNTNHRISQASKAYVSAVTTNGVAISGPPSTLAKLSMAKVFEAEPIVLPIHGPYHAPHLYSVGTVDKILRPGPDTTLRLMNQNHLRVSNLATLSGIYYENKELEECLRSILHDILMKPLQFQKTLEGCVSKVSARRDIRCLVTTYGPINSRSSLAVTLAGILKDETNAAVELRSSQMAEKVLAPSNGNHGFSGKPKLAIVGMSGRFPDAASHEKLWELLEKGLDVHREVPKDRFDVKTHFDPSGKITNTSHTPYGCWIENPGLFDPRFFNMSPREAFQTDPMQRLALTTAYEALEMSGYVPNRTRSTKLDRIGTFYGQTSDDWREINAAQDIDTYFITGGVRAFGPGRINYHFGFSGPSFSIDTACSSSAAALQLACTSLWAGDCDTAIVGGLSCMTNSDIFSGLSRGQFLSKNGPCATFDNDADGYCRADGVGTVIIKKLEDAILEKDNILGVILETQTNHSADAVSITHPHGGTQELLYQSILDKAGIDPLDIDYVEMHGTGTQAGDGTEMLSVTNVFAPPGRLRTPEQPLFLGAVKANVGHGEAASGVTALIKCLLMLQHNAIPPHVGIKKTINQGFPKDLGDRNVNIAFHKTPFRGKPGVPRRIFVNNFSAAGGNTGLLLEEAPKPAQVFLDPRPVHLITVTGKSKSALIRNCERLISHMDRNPQLSVADLAYTTTARRIQHNWRMSVSATDIPQLRTDLKANLVRDSFIPIPPKIPKVAFAFTGQGSHYAAMGKELYEVSSLFKKSIDDFENIAQIHGFDSFVGLIDGSVTDLDTLSPVATQLALVAFEIAIARLWSSWGINPSIVVGHSLGEYSALNIAGVLSPSDTIYLVGRRAQLLVEKCSPGTHSMLAVQGPISTIEDQLDNDVEACCTACINGPQERVFSGSVNEIENLAARLGKLGFKCTTLKVPFAFHSAQIDDILDDFQELAKSVTFNKGTIPIISSLLGRVVDEYESVDSVYLRNHARDSVKFYNGVASAQDAGFVDQNTVWIEIGPHPVCTNMIKTSFGNGIASHPTLRRGQNAYKTLTTTLSALHTAGVDIDWNEYHRDFLQSLHLLDLPSYSFDEKNYWIQYEGDWCLTKGRASAIAANSKLDSPPAPKLSTSSIHTVTEEIVDGDSVIISTESDLGRADLRGVVSGHVVNGALLCPSSLYADMAITLCEYAYGLIRPGDTNLGINVTNMQVPKSLLARPDGSSQILKLTAKLNTKNAQLSFSTGEGKDKVEHATCEVVFGQKDAYLSDWKRVAYLIQSRVDWLKAAEVDGRAHKIGRGLAYKLFSALVDYDDRYRGMSEVILHSENMEATSKVAFQTTDKDGNFVCSPYWIDSIAHISGFIVNGSDAINSQQTVYISHGWESFQVAEALKAEKKYRSYVRMQAEPGNIFAGDVYVFDEDRIIAKVGGLKFQGIPRKVLNMLLPPIGGAAKSAPPVKSMADVKPALQTVKEELPLAPRQVDEVGIKRITSSRKLIWTQILEILSTEIGVGIEELVDNIAFADLGVDSLMSLTVSGRIREEMEIDVHSHDFNDHATIGAFKAFVSKFETSESGSEADSDVNSSSRPTGTVSPASSTSVEDSPVIEIKPQRTATSVLLQGNSRLATKFLWIVPDGGGSATSYIDIPDLSPSVAVWGLNSPFMKCPEEYNIGVIGMAERFIIEMKRRQPTGPYLLSGWSAGGVIAFEIVNQLIKSGDAVEQLILIDSPCPDIIEPLPSSLHRWFASIGLLGDGETSLESLPPWLLPHFAASVTALSNYKAEKIDPTKSPLATIIWCEDGVCKLPTDPRPNPFPYGHAQFLLDNRTDFGPGLWERYLNEDRMCLERMPGNHFTMMKGDCAKILGSIMRTAVMKGS